MKKIIICIFIIIGIILVGILVKDISVLEVNAEIEGDNFVYIDYQKVRGITIYRFYDKNTKVIYMFTTDSVYNGGAGGLTVMLNEKGEPLLYQ